MALANPHGWFVDAWRRPSLQLAHHPISTTGKPIVFAFHGYEWLIDNQGRRRHQHFPGHSEFSVLAWEVRWLKSSGSQRSEGKNTVRK